MSQKKDRLEKLLARVQEAEKAEDVLRRILQLPEHERDRLLEETRAALFPLVLALEEARKPGTGEDRRGAARDVLYGDDVGKYLARARKALEAL